LSFGSEIEEVIAEFIQTKPKFYLFPLVTKSNSRIKLIPSLRNFNAILEHEPIFDKEELSLIAIDSNSNQISHF
jgi:hypothetical protein